MPVNYSKKQLLIALKIGALLAMTVCLLFLSGVFQRPEFISIDARYRLRGEAFPSSDIVIVGITQRCLNQLGKFPWPRSYHADIIDFLKKSGAKVIAMDIFFAQPSDDPTADQRLADAIKNAGNVILPVFMPNRISNLGAGDNFIRVDNLVGCMPLFVEASMAEAHINMIADADGIYRKAPVAIRYSENIFFALGIEAAIRFLGVLPGQIGLEEDYFILDKKRIPLERQKFFYINYSAIETRTNRFAYSDVLKGLVPAANFKNKIVFVGQTTQGLPNADILQTPFKEKYGLTVQANIANTILSDFYIKRPARHKTCVWIFILSALTCIIMICVRAWSSTGIVFIIFLTMCFIAARAFISSGALIEIVPLAAAILTSFSGSILYRIRFADTLVRAKELELDSILQAGRITSEGLETDNAFDVVLGTLINSIGVRGLLLRMRDKKTKEYNKTYIYGTAGNFLKSNLAQQEEKLVENVIKTGKAVLVEDTKKDALFGRVHDENSHSVMCAPLILKAERIGAVTLFDKLISGAPSEIYFRDDDLKLFLILSQQTAISLENLRLFEEVNSLFLSSIKALAETIDAKDPYTHGHAERVTDDALAIADEMDLSDDEKKRVLVGAILHDIGKIGIKDAVLSKPGRLSDEEKEMFDQHPDIGSKIMRPIKQLEDVIPMIRHHHEFYDGTGYPDKLKGEQIPLGARIIAVADTYDAMTSDRPYRKALSQEIAKGEINKVSGVQFDPRVVAAFNKAYIKGRLKKQ